MEYSSKNFYIHGIKGAYSEGEKQGYMLGYKKARKETAEKIFDALGFITYRKQGKAYIFDVKELRAIAKQFDVEI